MRLPPTTTLLPYTTLFRSAPSETGAGSEIGSENPPGSAEFPVTPVSSAVGGSPYMARPGQSSHLEQHGHEGPNVHERSEEDTSELQSHSDLVCRPPLEEKK